MTEWPSPQSGAEKLWNKSCRARTQLVVKKLKSSVSFAWSPQAIHLPADTLAQWGFHDNSPAPLTQNPPVVLPSHTLKHYMLHSGPLPSPAWCWVYFPATFCISLCLPCFQAPAHLDLYFPRLHPSQLLSQIHKLGRPLDWNPCCQPLLSPGFMFVFCNVFLLLSPRF